MTDNNIRITKRDGRLEVLNLDKIHRVLDWAAEGLDNVSTSQVELKTHIQFFDKMTTSDIHDTLIKSAADLISAETPDYQYLAARLAVFHLRKRAYGKYSPPVFSDHILKQTEAGRYTPEILEEYSSAEITELGDYIDHDRDLNFSYAAVKQLEGKYLIQNRVTGEVYESPQFLYMLVAMALLMKEPTDQRLSLVKKFYDAASKFKISLPTPIMSGVRTPKKQFSSCVVIESGDSLASINASASSIVEYISQRAGIGINVGRIRALGSQIRNGDSVHTGLIPFLKYFSSAVKSCSQGGVRGGAATAFYPLWHLESESLLVLKNNRGTEDNRVRQLDYGVQINGYLYKRLIKKDVITLFSPSDVPGLYEAFFADQKEFARLYEAAEQNPNIRQKKITANEHFSSLMQERASTGRIYIQNVDHCNTHSPFNPELAPVRQSNLCLEIALPTEPLNSLTDENGEISLCTLAAFNLGAIEDLSEFEELADIAVRALDNLLDYQDYPVLAAERSALARRSLGIGVVNYAYYLAKNGVKYSDESAYNLTHRTFEAIQYYLLKASNKLAVERGACSKFNETTYAQGILPIDTVKDYVNDYCKQELLLDWEGLREDIVQHGLRNSTLMALMPSETSSQILNATNGIEPPRKLVSTKLSKDGNLKQVVPDIAKLRNKYELLWSQRNNHGYIHNVGIMQKFVDQAISANTNYDPEIYEGGQVPMTLLMTDLLMAYKCGLKTLYYHQTRDKADEAEDAVEVEDMDCAGGACKI